MTDRRSFLSSLSAAGIYATHPRSMQSVLNAAVSVEAKPTVFFALPDGRTCLVRFIVSNIDAPAGRLRVFDRSRNLLGTAGVIRAGDHMIGELWLPLESTSRIISELEAPGLRGPLRTRHLLEPLRRWSLHFITVADASEMSVQLGNLRPIDRAVRATVYRDQSVTINPLNCSTLLPQLDHVPFLRITEQALNVEIDYALPMGTAAFCRNGEALPNTVPLALAGSGIRVLVRESMDENPFEWYEVPDGSKVLLVSVPPGSDPNSLGFYLPPDQMRLRLAEWLDQSAFVISTDDRLGSALVVNTVADESLEAVLSSIHSWNAQYAYPRIVVGNPQALFQEIESRAIATQTPERRSFSSVRGLAPEDLAPAGTLRLGQSSSRTQDMVELLGLTIDQRSTTLGDVSELLNTALPGTLVFNSSPYSRSELVTMTDGTVRMANDVPGLGYAHFVDAGDGNKASWEPVRTEYVLRGEQFRVEIDRSTGGISSVRELSSGREWVNQESTGINAVDRTDLEGIQLEQLDGVASRLTILRRSVRFGEISTRLTVYDDLPWLDIENEVTDTTDSQIDYDFPFDLTDPHLSWEIPAGTDVSIPPIEHQTHLRWIRIVDGESELLFRGIEAPVFSFSLEGVLRSLAPSGRSRYRLGSIAQQVGPDSAWVFGWGTEPFVVHRAEPTGKNSIPRFGSLFTVEKVGVTVLGIQAARLPNAAILYLQETLGLARQISVGPGVIRFGGATAVDYLERAKEQIPVGPTGIVETSIPAYGIVALRLEDLEVVDS